MERAEKEKKGEGEDCRMHLEEPRIARGVGGLSRGSDGPLVRLWRRPGHAVMESGVGSAMQSKMSKASSFDAEAQTETTGPTTRGTAEGNSGNRNAYMPKWPHSRFMYAGWFSSVAFRVFALICHRKCVTDSLNRTLWELERSTLLLCLCLALPGV